MKDLRLEQQLCFALYSAGHAFTRFYRPLLAELGVTYPQYLALLTLWEEDGLTVSAIGERLLLDSGTLTPVLKRLEAMELVRRERSNADGRQVVITLTPKGREMAQVAQGFPMKVLEAADCSSAEIGALRSALFSLRDKLDRAAA
jgi:DNA-binding MarR family transcriptional regulator